MMLFSISSNSNCIQTPVCLFHWILGSDVSARLLQAFHQGQVVGSIIQSTLSVSSSRLSALIKSSLSH